MRIALSIGAVAILAVLALLAWELHGDEPPREPTEPAVTRTTRREPARTPRADSRPIPSPVRTDHPAPSGSARLPDAPWPPSAGTPKAARVPDAGLADAMPSAGDAPRDRVKEIMALFNRRDYENAHRKALVLMHDYPEEVEGYLIAGYSSCAMGEPEQVREVLAKLKSKRNRSAIIDRCTELGMTLNP